MNRLVVLIVFAACSSQARSPTEPPAGSAGDAPVRPNRRCLPVVTSECGCVYSCAVGLEHGDHWRVRHAFWKDAELKAKVAKWCVDGECTEAFDAEIVCDGICPRKPADSTCRFVADGCVSGTEISSK